MSTGFFVMPKAKLGTKRSCSACGMRYYDLNRTPIICPSCSTEFDPESLVKTRKARTAQKPANDDDEAVQDDVVNIEGDDEAVVSSDDDVSNDDLDYDDDDESEDGLIRDDISADDELLSNIPDKDDE